MQYYCTLVTDILMQSVIPHGEHVHIFRLVMLHKSGCSRPVTTDQILPVTAAQYR